MNAHTWNTEGLGKSGKQYFAYPTSPEGITVKVSGEDPEQVAEIANFIENAMRARRDV